MFRSVLPVAIRSVKTSSSSRRPFTPVIRTIFGGGGGPSMVELMKLMNNPKIKEMMDNPEIIKAAQELSKNKDEVKKMSEYLMNPENIAKLKAATEDKDFGKKFGSYVDELIKK